MAKTAKPRRQVLRTHRPPMGIPEFLFLANSLPAESDLSEEHNTIVNSQLAEHDADGNHYTVFAWHMRLRMVNESLMKQLLLRAIEPLRDKLKVFVNPPEALLKNGAAPWLRALGPTLVDFAVEASGGLDWNEDSPSFRYSEGEAFRQRYLFLFGLREILDAIAEAHLSIEDARTNLEEAQYYSIPSPILSQVRAFTGWFDIAKEVKNRTHRLTYVKPRIISLLEQIESERIRRCPICKSVFWADRLDKIACSPRCANTLRARRWRQKQG